MNEMICVSAEELVWWSYFSEVMAVTWFILAGCLLAASIGVYRFLRVPPKSSSELKSGSLF